MSVNGALSQLEQLHAFKDDELDALFEQLPSYGKCIVEHLFRKARFLDNCEWNRYSDIRPFDGSIPQFSIKKVPSAAGFSTEQNINYYNASSVLGGRAISAESPMECNLDLFYGMIDQTGVTTVVTLTNAEEKGEEKSYDYWLKTPDASASVAEEDGEVLFEKDTHRIVRRTLNLDGVSHLITHYHLENWEDCKVVDPSTLAELIKTVDKVQGPLLVHCSAGIGRAGTFLAPYEAHIDQNPDLPGIIHALRSPRTGRPNMIQKKEQHRLAYETARLLLPQEAASADLA